MVTAAPYLLRFLLSLSLSLSLSIFTLALVLFLTHFRSYYLCLALSLSLPLSFSLVSLPAQNRPLAQRALVVAAGVVANLVLAWGCYAVPLQVRGVPERVYAPGVVVASVASPSPGYR
jgi:hypothetical protein